MVEPQSQATGKSTDNLTQISNTEESGLSLFRPKNETNITAASNQLLQDYDNFLKVRGRFLKIIRHEDLQGEKKGIIDEMVDIIFEEQKIPTDPLSSVLSLLGMGKKLKERLKERELSKKVIQSLLEQIFDPKLNFIMKKQDILDTFEANGLARDRVTRAQMDKIYSTILHYLKVGKLRDLAYEESIYHYIQEKIQIIVYSRLEWRIHS